MPSSTDHYRKSFLQIATLTALSCLYAILIALIVFFLETPIAILVSILISLYPLRYIRAHGWLTIPDDTRLFGALSLILLVIGGINSADLLWIFSGMSVLYLALVRHPKKQPSADHPPISQTLPYSLRKTPLIMGALLIGLVAEASGQLLMIPLFAHIPTTVQFLMLISAIMLIIAGISGDVLFTSRRWGRGEIIISLIVMLGLVLRVYQLGEAQRFVIDEMLFIKPIINIWDHDSIPLFLPFSTIASFPLIYPYLQSWSVELFGISLTGIRVVSVLFGTAGISALYLLVRALFGRRTALISALVLATLPIHIQFSRIGINNIADPLFGTLALYFIAQSTRQPDRMSAYLGLAGVCTGLTQYWYDGGRFIFLALVMLWLGALLLRSTLQAIRHNQKQRLKTYFQACLIFSIGFGLIAFPVYYTLYASDKPISSRFERVGINLNDYLQYNRLSNHARTGLKLIYNFHFNGPEVDFYYAGDDPIMPRHTVPFFLGGLFFALTLLFNRQLVGLLVVCWLGLTWIGNLWLETPDISARYVVELPLIALLIGLGIDRFAGLIVRHKRWAGGIAIALTVVFGGVQVHHYFGDYMERFNYQFRHEQAGRNRDVDDLLLRAVDFPPSAQIYILDETPFPSSDLDNLLRFYRGVKQGWRYTVYVLPPYDAVQTPTLRRLNRSVTQLLFVPIVTPNGMDTLLLELYPDEIIGPFYTDYHPSMSSQYALYILPALD